MKKLVIAVVALVVLGVGGVFGLEYYAQSKAEARVDAILAQLQPGATATRGTVRYSLWDNVAEIDQIALAFSYADEATLTIDKLVLVEPAEDASGVVTIESFEATGLALQLAGLTFEPPIANLAGIPALRAQIDRYHGKALRITPDYIQAYRELFALEIVSLDDPVFLGLLDPIARGLDAAELIAEGYDGTVQLAVALPQQEAVDLTYDFTLTNFVLRDLKDGRMGSQVMEDLSVDTVIGGPAAMKAVMTADSLSVNGVDLVTLVKAYGPVDPNEPGSFEPIMEEFAMEGLTYQITGDELPDPLAIEVARVTLSDYAVRPGLLAFINMDLENATPEELAGFFETMLGLYRIGEMEIAGMKVSKAAGDQAADGQAAAGAPLFTLDRVVVADYEGARLGKIVLENLAAAVEGEGSFALANFELGGLDYSGAVANWQKLAAGEPWPLGSMPKLDLMALAGLRVETDGAAMTLEELRGESADYVQSVATHSTFLMRELEVPLDFVPDPSLAGIAELMELDRVTLSFAGGYRWDIPAREARMEGFEFRLHDLGVLNFEMAVTGLGEEFIAAVHGDMAALAPEALQELFLGGARLTYQDQSLLPRAIKALAQTTGQDEAEIKAGYGAQAEAFASMLQDPALIEKVVAALRAFIADPKKLEIALTPVEPVSMLLIPSLSEAAPGELAKALNLTVQANQ